MNDKEEPAVPSTLEAAAEYLKSGGGYDVAVAALFLTHGVPVPPSIIKRFRIGAGRLIDGSFDILAGGLARIKARSDFEAKIQQAVVKGIAQAGAGNLVQNSPDVTANVALSMLNEYGLKLENKAAAAQHAFEDLVNSPPLPDESPDADISEDWLNYFSDIAAQKSDPEMQRLMGRILAGEIRKPGSFSPMTVSVLATLTPTVAQKFEKLCSVAIDTWDATLILTNVFPDFLKKGIPEIDLNYVDVLTLRSHQLLANETGSSWNFKQGQTVEISNCGVRYLLRATEHGGNLDIPAALFSNVGYEMRRLVSPNPVPWFNEKLLASFSQPQWHLEKTN